MFFFKQKTAYEMRISDWSSDVCSSDLICAPDVSASFAFFRCRRPMKALLEAAFFGCDEMLLRFVGLAEHFGQMLDGADEIVFFAQTAVEFHVERADRDRKSVVLGKSVSVR